MILASCHRTPETIVNLHMDGPRQNTEVVLMTKDSNYVITLDSTNTASFILSEKIKPGYAVMYMDDRHILTYVDPGKSFNITARIDGTQIISTFNGAGAAKSQYLNHSVPQFTPDFKLNEADFIASLDKKWQKMDSTLMAQVFDDTFNRLEKNRLTYTIYRELPKYFFYHPFETLDANYKPSEAIYTKLREVFTEDESLLDLAAYQEFINEYVIVMLKLYLNNVGQLQYAKNQLHYIEQNFKKPAIIEYLTNRIIYAYIEQNGIKDLPELTVIYNAKVTDKEKKHRFKELCGKWLRIAPGQPSPSFKCQDINGKEISLSDLKGKYIYIDNWATWCGPCCREIPALEKLEKKYRDKNIYFVSISYDEDKTVWEKKVKKENLSGIQLHIGTDYSFAKTYMISAIPRFILLDREGYIINAHMSHPSDPETIHLLDTLEGI